MAQGDQRTLRDTGPAGSCLSMTSSSTYQQGRAVLINCTTAGTLTFTFSSGSTLAMNLAQAGVYEFNWAITGWAAGTVSATVFNLY